MIVTQINYPKLPALAAEVRAFLATHQGKPTVPEVAHLFKAYLEVHSVWGSLHIVLDDFNLQDSHVEYCRTWARSEEDEAGEALAELLLRMSITQRMKIARLR